MKAIGHDKVNRARSVVGWWLSHSAEGRNEKEEDG
jgi:hypothetical protein